MSTGKDYYAILGVNKSSSQEEIKKAYRNQAKKWHPDLNKDPKAPEMAKKINEAKEILLDEEKRKDYDIYLENYKSGMYDNLNKNDNKSNYNHNTQSNYEEKTYTKWEYFKLYLKYYNINKFRKIIGTVFVLLESLLCTILQIINYILALIISLLGYYIMYGLTIIGGLLIMVVIANLIFKITDFSSSDYILMIISAIISITISVLIPSLPYIFANKIPILISKLNMFLFKLSIGYKN